MRKAGSIVVASLLLLAAACGGSSSKNNNALGIGNNGTNTTTAGGGGSGSNNSGDNSGNNEFSQLSEQSKHAKIKITYTDQDGKQTTIAQDGNGKSLFMSDSNAIYTDNGKTVSCDGTDSTAKCTEMTGALGNLGNTMTTVFTSLYAGLAKLDKNAYGGHSSDETIAGRDAKCITFKASDVGGLAGLAGGKDFDPSAQAKVCWDKSTGFLLEWSATSNGKSQELFHATAVSDPSDSDFNPPSTPETMPNISLPPGMTLPPGITLPNS